MAKNELELVLGNLVSAVNTLQKCTEFASLVPEVRVNMVYALPEAKTSRDVAAIEGRITAVGGFPRASGMPVFGASDHMARLIIEVRKYSPHVNAGINFRCDDTVIEVVKEFCRERGISFGWIDRTKEPEEVTRKDGSSMPWKIKYLANTYGSVPQIFYEGAGWGKEPLFVAVGKDAVEVVEIAVEVAKRIKMMK